MSGDYGNDFVTIVDDDGEEFELEHLDTMEIDGELYMAFIPADMAEDDDDFGLVILKVVPQDDEDDEDALITVDDEDELNTVYAMFVERLSEEEED